MAFLLQHSVKEFPDLAKKLYTFLGMYHLYSL